MSQPDRAHLEALLQHASATTRGYVLAAPTPTQRRRRLLAASFEDKPLRQALRDDQTLRLVVEDVAVLLGRNSTWLRIIAAQTTEALREGRPLPKNSFPEPDLWLEPDIKEQARWYPKTIFDWALDPEFPRIGADLVTRVRVQRGGRPDGATNRTPRADQVQREKNRRKVVAEYTRRATQPGHTHQTALEWAAHTVGIDWRQARLLLQEARKDPAFGTIPRAPEGTRRPHHGAAMRYRNARQNGETPARAIKATAETMKLPEASVRRLLAEASTMDLLTAKERRELRL